MSGEMNDFNKIVEIERNQFIWTGLYPQRTTPTIFYNLRGIFSIFFSSALAWSMIISLRLTSGDLFKVIDILYFLLSQSAFLGKLINFMANRRKLLNIEECLKHEILYKYFEEHGRKYLTEVIFICNFLSGMFRVTVFFVVLFYGTFPLFDKDPEKTLPFAGWYPFDMVKYHKAIYTFQMCCLFVSAIINSNLDIYTTFLISIGVILLRMLKNCLKNVDYSNGKDSVITEENLGELVTLHKQVILYIVLIEEMFSYGIFVQFLASILVICLTGFQMLVVNPGSAQFILLIFFLACMMCQVILYCWFGNEILTESEGISLSCYMSNWYEGTNKSKKVVCLIMERSKRNIRLTAGKFFILSLGTLLMIWKSSYSYYAVLQRFYKEN